MGWPFAYIRKHKSDFKEPTLKEWNNFWLFFEQLIDETIEYLFIFFTKLSMHGIELC